MCICCHGGNALTAHHQPNQSANFNIFETNPRFFRLLVLKTEVSLSTVVMAGTGPPRLVPWPPLCSIRITELLMDFWLLSKKNGCILAISLNTGTKLPAKSNISLYSRYHAEARDKYQPPGPSRALCLGNTVPKKRRSGGERSATLWILPGWDLNP